MNIKIGITRFNEILFSKSYSDFEGVLTFGNKSKSVNIQLPDSKAHDYHFDISFLKDSIIIKDNQTVYGTRVNGEAILFPTQLNNGDIIEVGDLTIEVENVDVTDETNIEAIEANLPEDELETIDISVSDIDDKTQVISEIKTYILLGIHGKYTGKRYKLNKDETVIGRDAINADISLNELSKNDIDESISRKHFKILRIKGKYYLQDQLSKLRTWINDEKLEKGDLLELSIGDEIAVYSPNQTVIFRFNLENALDTRVPRKAGYWHIKRLPDLLKIGVILSFIWLIYNIFQFSSDYRNLTKYKPGNINTKFIPIINTTEGTKCFIGEFNPRYGNELLTIGTNNVECYSMISSGNLWKVALDSEIKSSFWLQDFNGDSNTDILLSTADTKINIIDGLTGSIIYSSTHTLQDIISVISVESGQKTKIYAFSSEGTIFHFEFERFNLPSFGQLKTINLGSSFIAPLTPLAKLVGNNTFLAIPENGKVIFSIDYLNDSVNNYNLQTAIQTSYGDPSRKNYTIYSMATAYDFNDDNSDEVILKTRDLIGIIYEPKSRSSFYKIQAPNLSSIRPNVEQSTPAYILPGEVSDRILVYWYKQSVEIFKAEDIRKNNPNPSWIKSIETDLPQSPISVFDFNKDGNSDLCWVNAKNQILVFDGTNGSTLFTSDPIPDKLELGIIAGDIKSTSTLQLLCSSNNNIYLLNLNIPLSTGTILWNSNIGKNGNGLNPFIPKLGKDQMVNLIISGLLSFIIGGAFVYFYLNRKKKFQLN